MTYARHTKDLIRALGRHDASLAMRHAELFGGDPIELLHRLTKAREAQLEDRIGRLYFGGWWPGRDEDMAVLCRAAAAAR